MLPGRPGIAPRLPGRAWLLPALSGLLLTAAFPPLHLLVPSFVALVPVAWWVLRLPAADPRAALAGGFVLGAVHHATALLWMGPALGRVTALAWPVFSVAVALLAAVAAGVVWLLHRAVHRAGVPVALALPVAWTAGEWVQGHLPGGLAFPWVGLGTSLTRWPEWLGIAEVAGARGVTFWLAAVSGVLAEAMGRRARAGAPATSAPGPPSTVQPASAARAGAGPAGVLRAWMLPMAVVLGPVLLGLGLTRASGTESVGSVALVQGALPAGLRTDPAGWNAAARAALEDVRPALLPDAAARSVDAIVLPEGWVMLGAPGAEALLAGIGALAVETGAPVLFGAYGPDEAEGAGPGPGPDTGPSRTSDAAADRAPGGPAVSVNAVRIARPDGTTRTVHRKERLVPIVEVAPFGGRPWAGGDGFAPGRAGGEPFGVAGMPWAASICFESAFESVARRARAEGARVLVNVSNDAWFALAGWAGEAARAQHEAHAVMRALEHRVAVVRSANGGASFVVDPSGRVHGGLDRGEAGVVVAEVRTGPGPTVYTRMGDWVGWGSLLAAVLLVLAGSPSLDPRRSPL